LTFSASRHSRPHPVNPVHPVRRQLCSQSL